MNNKKHIGCTIDECLLEKFRCISRQNGRSINRQIVHMIKQCIAEYEEKCGSINIDEST